VLYLSLANGAIEHNNRSTKKQGVLPNHWLEETIRSEGDNDDQNDDDVIIIGGAVINAADITQSDDPSVTEGARRVRERIAKDKDRKAAKAIDKSGQRPLSKSFDPSGPSFQRPMDDGRNHSDQTTPSIDQDTKEPFRSVRETLGPFVGTLVHKLETRINEEASMNRNTRNTTPRATPPEHRQT
jgi:hypothetical protein